MAQAEGLNLLKLLLEVNHVENPGRVCQQLYKHGVTSLTKFAKLTVQKLLKWGIDDYNVFRYALPHARKLLRDSSRDLAAIREQLLVRTCMHYIRVRNEKKIEINKYQTSTQSTSKNSQTSCANFSVAPTFIRVQSAIKSTNVLMPRWSCRG